MMVRTQILLSSELHNRVRTRAANLGVSLAETIRGLIDRDLTESRRQVDRSVVFDLGRSKGTNIASRKGAMIAEATRTALRHT